MTEVLFDDIVDELVKELKDGIVHCQPKSETEFDRDFVAPRCEEILNVRGPEWDWAVHPWGDKHRAEAWAKSKEWGAISTWGMHHTLDLVARESSSGKKLGVEIKLAKMRGRHAPTGDFQRMVGQCLIGRLVHDVVIGVFGISPADREAKQHVAKIISQFEDDTCDYRLKLEEHGIRLIVRQIDSATPVP